MRNDSCILVVTNLAANEINSVCTNLFSGESTVCYSADSVFDSEDDCRYPVEFLNSLSVPGLPDHILNLKTGMPVILLRNLCPKSGLCNGVRLIVKAVLNKRLVAVHFSNRESTETMLIPRISLVVDETASVPLKWKRRQFPLKPAFSLTINKVHEWLFGSKYLCFPTVSSTQRLLVSTTRITSDSMCRPMMCYRRLCQQET